MVSAHVTLSPHHLISRWPIWIVAALVLVAFALRLINLGHGDLSFDEAASALIARKSLAEMIPYLLRAIHEHPPAYYALLSGWIRLTGDGEAMLRMFSVLLGTLSIPLMYRWARDAVGVTGGLLAALMLSVTPAHVFYSQNARMYSMVGVWALLSWWLLLRLQRSDRLKAWIGLSACGLIGLATHYYMGLVITAQGAYLLLTWKHNKRLFGKWLVWLGVPLGLGAVYVAASPGALVTLMTAFAEGLGSGVSARALRSLAADLVFGPHGNLGINVWSAILLIALGGIGLALSGRVGVKRPVGIMLLCALCVPLALILLLPEAIAARYVLFLVFPLLLALTVVIVSPLALRDKGAVVARVSWAATALAALALIALSVSRLPYHYAALKGDYGKLMAQLQAQYRPGDGVIFNGPWQAILQTYYPIGDVPFVYLPPQTPPALDPVATEPQLAELLKTYRRLWVVPLAVDVADPDRFVARWLDEHAYPALEQPGLALYYVPPATGLPALTTPLQFGPAVELTSARIATGSLSTGANAAMWRAALVTLEWRALQPIGGDVQVGLEVVDPGGSVWGRRLYRPGERYTTAGDWNSGATIVDRQAILIDPGAPPGAYALRITVQRASTGELLAPLDSPGATYANVAPLRIDASTGSIPDDRLPGTRVGVRFGDSLSLVSYRLPSGGFTQGGVIPITLYWRALGGDREVSVDVALVNDAGHPIDVSRGALGPAWYPAAQWQPGEIVATSAALQVPPRLAPGTYGLCVTARDRAGRPVAARGVIARPGFLGLWTDRVEARLDTWRLGDVSIAARERNFSVPVVQRPLPVTFGDQIKLVGYDLDSADARAGGQLRVTFYWQALKETDQNYVVFTHLRDAAGELRGQRDSMPAGGSNPTWFWQTGEVVADTVAIAIDPGAPPGSYTLGFGWYESDTGTRLAAIGADGARHRDDIVVIVAAAF